MKTIICVFTCLIAMNGWVLYAQPVGAERYDHRNNIKFNLSGNLLYTNMFVFTYERTLDPHKTFSITAGYLEFPSFSDLVKNVHIDKKKSKSGYTFGGDYRFYLAKENKYPAPHGIYIGPYINYYHFNNERDITAKDSVGNTYAGSLDTKIEIFNIGFQLGYQFVINNRFTIDLTLFAPSISRYSANLSLSQSIPDPDLIVRNEILNGMINRFPLVNKLVTERSVDVSGKRNVLAPGLKYCVNLGYRFGR